MNITAPKLLGLQLRAASAAVPRGRQVRALICLVSASPVTSSPSHTRSKQPSAAVRTAASHKAAEPAFQPAEADMTVPPADLHVQQAWEFWQRIGAPKFHVAPMVDQVNKSCVVCLADLRCS